MNLYKFLIILLFTSFAITVTAQSSRELERKKEAYQREIEQLQKVLNKTAKGKKLTVQQYNAVNTQIRLRQNKIGIINSEIKNIDNQISTNTNTVHTLQGQLGDLKKEYAGMVRFAQRNRNAYDKMMFIFAAKDFNQAYKRIKYLQQFSQYRKKQAGYIESTKKDLNGKIQILDKTLKEKNNLLESQEREKDKLGKDKKAQAALIGKFNKQEKQIKQDIATRKKQQAQIDRAIRDAINREIAARRREEEATRVAAAKAAAIAAAKARAENKPVAKESEEAKPVKTSNSDLLTSTPADMKLSAGFENNRGRLPWPVGTGSITERFGVHKVDQASINNEGVNITTADGSSVRAVFDGEVFMVQTIYGKYFVVIKHGDYFTVYQNLRSVSVSKGDKVSTKQTIGVVANTGDVAELHFEIMRGQNKQNPEAWISK